MSQFVTVHNTTFQNDVNYAIRYTPKCRKDVHINIGPYQEGFLCTSILGFIIDIHTKRCTSEITPESANMKLFKFMSKVNMGTLPSTHNTFSALLESICHVTALIKLRQITNCDDSVAICDCRNFWRFKYNVSEWCQLCQKVYSLVQKTCWHQHRTLSRRFPLFIDYGLSNFCRKDFFHATISIEKSTSEIDADLAQNEM